MEINGQFGTLKVDVFEFVNSTWKDWGGVEELGVGRLELSLI